MTGGLVLPALPGAVLQQSGPAAAGVLIATTSGLVDVDLDNGAVTTLVQADGVPVAPVVNGDCRFGAWLPSPTLPSATLPAATQPKLQAVAACGDAAPVLTELAGSTPAATLGFPAARRRRGARRQHLRPLLDRHRQLPGGRQLGRMSHPPSRRTTPKTPTSARSAPTTFPRCRRTARMSPRRVTPQAADDVLFGVRAGRATVLRVLDNDPSVNCTSVVIDSVSALPPEVGTVAIVGGGSAIQVTVPEASAPGPLPPIDVPGWQRPGRRDERECAGHGACAGGHPRTETGAAVRGDHRGQRHRLLQRAGRLLLTDRGRPVPACPRPPTPPTRCPSGPTAPSPIATPAAASAAKAG